MKQGLMLGFFLSLSYPLSAQLPGDNLASTGMQARAVPLPTSLGDVRVSVCAPGSQLQCATASLLFVSPSQINFVIPDVVPGNGTVLVSNAGGVSSQLPLYLRSGAPGIYHMGWDCALPAICPVETLQTGSTRVQRGSIVDESGTLVSSMHPLRSGHYYSLYVTGLGLSTTSLQMTLAGKAAGSSQVGIIPMYVGPSTSEGLEQINFMLPDNASAALEPPGFTPACSATRDPVPAEMLLTVAAGSLPDEADAISVPVYVRAADIVCQP